MKYRLLTTLSFWLDLAYTTVSIALLFNLIHEQVKDRDIGDLKNYRELEVIGVIIIYIRGLTFLKLVDSIAPMIETIKSIVYDIINFMLVLTIFIAMIAICFYLLG